MIIIDEKKYVTHTPFDYDSLCTGCALRDVNGCMKVPDEYMGCLENGKPIIFVEKEKADEAELKYLIESRKMVKVLIDLLKNKLERLNKMIKDLEKTVNENG